MPTRIRLKRLGTTNRLQWRIVVVDAKMPRDGRFIEEIGYYDPLPVAEKIVIKEDRMKYWVAAGAEVSQTVKSLVKRTKRGKAG